MHILPCLPTQLAKGSGDARVPARARLLEHHRFSLPLSLFDAVYFCESGAPGGRTALDAHADRRVTGPEATRSSFRRGDSAGAAVLGATIAIPSRRPPHAERPS